MITIIHGDNHVASRNVLIQLIEESKQKKTEDITHLNGVKLELTQLIQSLESKSLFGSEKLVVIENLLTRQRSKTKTAILEYLKKQKINTDLIIWEPKTLTATQLKGFPKTTQIKLFKIGPIIFKFLDSIAPPNHKQMLLLYHQCLKSDAPELIFYMLARRVSQLIIANDLGVKGLDKLAPWQKSRLVSQAKKFNLNQLTLFHNTLYQTDYNVKTGKNVLPLSSTLDLVLADI